MRLFRLKSPDKRKIVRPFAIFSVEKHPLRVLERGVHFAHLKQFKIKSLEPYQDGFISVWQFGKDELSPQAFQTAYLLAIGETNLKVANQHARTNEAKARWMRQRETEKRAAKAAPKPKPPRKQYPTKCPDSLNVLLGKPKQYAPDNIGKYQAEKKAIRELI